MKISQEIARRIAGKLTDKKSAQVQKLKNKYLQLITDMYRNSIPTEVINCYKKHPDWFERTGYIDFEGNGFRRESVTVVGEYVIANNNGHARLSTTPEIAAEIKKAKTEWENAKDESEKLLQETYNALLALGTYKKIEEHFPQAAPFLPVTGPKMMALIPNLDGLKKKLQTQ